MQYAVLHDTVEQSLCVVSVPLEVFLDTTFFKKKIYFIDYDYLLQKFF